MILDELVLENFGPYRSEQRIALAPPSSSRPVVLIGALNGAGKTSILDALQLALYGRFAACSGRGALGYDAFLRRSIHRSADVSAGARLELQFRHAVGGTEHTYRVRRSWAETSGTVRESVQVLVDGALDRVMTETWESQVETFLPRRIAPLFFFDGEKIESFADPQRSAELLSVAVHSLLGVDLVEQLSADLVVLERRSRAPSRDPELESRLESAKMELQWATERYELAGRERAAAQSDLDRGQQHLRELEDRFRREGGELYEQRERLEHERAAIAKEMRLAGDRLLELMAGHAPLFLVRGLLERVAAQAAREDAIYRASSLNELLVQRDHELLRELLRTGVSAGVMSTVQQHLSNDRDRREQESAGERYLHLGSEARLQLNDLRENLLSDEGRAQVMEALEHSRECQARLDDVDRTLSRVPNSDAISGLLESLNQARTAHEEALARLSMLDEVLRHAANEREARQKRLESAHAAAAESRFEEEVSERLITHSARVRATLQHFRGAMVARHVERIQEHILNSFRRLLRKERLVSTLSIDPATYAIRLGTPDGQLLSPDRLSAGERQLLAVATLWGLARASGRNLPIVVDTPLGRLDSAHRANLLERYFPHAGGQVVLLATDTEIDARGRRILHPYLGVEQTLHFDETLGATRVEQGYLWAEEGTHAH